MKITQPLATAHPTFARRKSKHTHKCGLSKGEIVKVEYTSFEGVNGDNPEGGERDF